MNHAAASDIFNRDEARVDWHDGALWFVRQKRDRAARQVPEWESLREIASQIKAHTLANLEAYLVEFEEKAQQNGIQVHWAADAEEHNRIVLGIIRSVAPPGPPGGGERASPLPARQTGPAPLPKEREARRSPPPGGPGIFKTLSNMNFSRARHSPPPGGPGGAIVKSKSMLTEECHLNPFLEKNGIEVIDTDLGERIVQLRDEPPSHIVLPAIHLKKQEVGETFHEHLGTEAGASDPQYLTEAARQHLREKFIAADVALTGVNFAVAETGGFVVCTNEGNADMGAHLARVHIACMGFEKIIPKAEHLGVFLRLLARSATGQPVTTYSSHFQRPRRGQEMHVVIVDNGRSAQLGRPAFRNSLKCIRCGACINTCPVYRRSGGHSYHNAVSGPIGVILAPNLDMEKNADLPFASTLCGSCTHVCPVKIDIHDQIWRWRQVVTEAGYAGFAKKHGVRAMRAILSNPALYRFAGAVVRKILRFAPFLLKNRLNPWFKNREMPEAPKESFGDWYLKNRGGNGK